MTISHVGMVFADAPVKTPIKHVIVIVGENVTFDTLYGTYKPPEGQNIRNLLSEGIVDANGTPGPNYAKALQRQPRFMANQYQIRPPLGKAYPILAQPLEVGIFDADSFRFKPATPDGRFPANLPNGPFQITKYVPYGSVRSATGEPALRFFQMWQQTRGDNIDHSLFAWVATTVGAGEKNSVKGPKKGLPQQGGELMGFYNMAQGDAPIFSQLAKDYALSDNYHQAIMGGTGPNFFTLATADVAVYNKNGVLTRPPANQIENPDPKPETNNIYQHDGYASGSYVNCSDPSQPGVSAIVQFLKLKKRASNCEKGTYYLINNYDLPYTPDGAERRVDANKFVYPPQQIPTIGEALSAKNVSWKWYTAGRDAADVLNDSLYPVIHALADTQVPSTMPQPLRTATVNAKTFSLTQSIVYNSIGDPMNASFNIVNTPALHSHLQGFETFFSDIDNNTLPAVSFVVPKNPVSDHPDYSTPARYELFISELLKTVQANSDLWSKTAIIITSAEGKGYFDSGYIQNLDFFGDGPRIPLLVVSPYAKKGYVDHTYNDHASILKFIEYNWGLTPLSPHSRDNLPNPINGNNPYWPENQPAIGDLTTLFDFSAKQ